MSQPVHYGSNGAAECGCQADEMLLSKAVSEVTCPTCKGWLPIIAPELQPASATAPDVWAIVELMGHVRLAGRLTEEEKFGSKLGRLDIPNSQPCEACAGTGQTAFMQTQPCGCCKGSKVEPGFITQFFGGNSVYRITIVTEAVARHTSKQTAPAPVSPWDYPKSIAAAIGHVGPRDDDGEDE